MKVPSTHEGQTYNVGEIVSGEVTGIQSYGAFVKLPNGEQGLIHISEISTFFVKSVSNFVQLGQTIKVKIIEILETLEHNWIENNFADTPNELLQKAKNLF